MSSPQGTALFCLGGLAVYLLYCTARLAVVVACLLAWGLATYRLTAPDEAASRQNLKEALASPSKPDDLTEAWYDAWWGRLAAARPKTYVGGGAALLLLVLRSYPANAAAALGDALQGAWTSILARGMEPLDLFLLGSLGVHLVVFWFWRPACLEPYKVQPDFVLTVPVFLKAVAVDLFNEVLLVGAILLTLKCCPRLLGAALAPELPSLITITLQLAVCLPVSEALFFFTHLVLHTPFMWEHVHYVHHSFDAPFALGSIYAHPVEFVWANVPVILGPAILVRPHLVVWAIWAARRGAEEIINGHLGWHLPFIGSPEPHDFHHSLDGGRNLNNLGQLGVLDALFGTEQDWLAAWQRDVDKTYHTPDYPVDRVLAQDAALARERKADPA